MHKHTHCLHNKLKYCEVCDVVYCEDCGREWGGYSYSYQPWVTTDWYTTSDLPYCDTGSASCMHMH